MPLLPLIALSIFLILWTRETLYKSELSPSAKASGKRPAATVVDAEDLLKVYLLKPYLSEDPCEGPSNR
ncbi:MAG: hypothetical protein AAF152_05405 [Cyanobacteria bacterium P01_A01_bin.114]